MTVYVRRFPCSVCGKNVYYDDENQKLRCRCGSFKATFVNLQEFQALPKYDRKYWKSETYPIDCAKFLSNEILLDGSNVLFISDRQSIIKGNENPHAVLRWIHYPEKDKVQLCIAISGAFHAEKISYNTKNANEWKERMWIFLPREILPKMLAFLERDPDAVASWIT